MTVRWIYIWSFLLLCVIFAVADDDGDAITKLDKFSWLYHQEAAKLKPKKNVATCSSSVVDILTLLLTGSTGDTREQLRSVLGSSGETWRVIGSITRIKEIIHSMKNVRKKEASGIFLNVDDDLIEDDFQSYGELLGVNVESIDTDKSFVDRINDWAAYETDDAVGPILNYINTNASIFNAVSFEGEWRFNSSKNSTMKFYVNDDKVVDVVSLEAKGLYKYGSSDDMDTRFVLMPNRAKEDGAYMLLILPNNKNGLDDVLQKISDGDGIRDYVNSLIPANVTIHVPKFWFETYTDLTATLPKLGVTRVFDPSQSGLTTVFKKGINDVPVITQGVQKVIFTLSGYKSVPDFVDVRGPPRDVVDFNVDHPFAVLIFADSDKSMGPLICTVRVNDPSQKI